MKWLLGFVCSLLLLNVLAQQQTVNDLRAELRQAHVAAQAATTAPTDTIAPTDPATPTDTATPTDSATPQTSATKRPMPRITWTGDVGTCNKADKEHDWWKFTHAYISDPVKYASYNVWFLYSQSYVDSFAYCFDKTFVNKVNEIAATIS